VNQIILVHGAFHTGECWFLLRPILERRGFAVQTPTLRGQRGNPRHPLRVTWKTYAEDIVACAEKLSEPAILLGHSMGGFSISAAAEKRPDLFSSLIYLAPAVPKLGRSTLRDAMTAEQASAPRPKMSINATFPADRAAGHFYNCCTPEIQARAAALLSPQPLRPLLGAINTTPAKLGAIPKHFFECLQDRTMPIAGQREKQANLKFDTVQTLDSDHSPFLSAPEALADAIERVCAR
jgi:pimeloyl-ACP methyl ester carboxylesterase